MKRNLLKVLGLVMILALTVTPVMAEPDVDPNPGSGNTDVVIMNMGSAATTATAMYYSASGQNMYQVPTNLAVKGSHRFAASAASPLGDNWKGSMVVQSAGEVAAIAEILWTNGNSLDGTTADAYTGFTTGATTMYVPYALYARDAQFTLFSVQNTESTTANIRLTFVNRDGAQDYQFTDTIPALGSKSYDMRAITQLQSTSFWTSTCATGACHWTGSVKIESTNGKMIATAATNHWMQYASAYSGTASGTTKSFVSSVERRCEDCTFNPGAGQIGNWQGFSIVVAQCLSATPCNVRFEFIGQPSASGTMGSLTLTRTINPGVAIGANTRAGGNFNQSDYNVLRNSNDPANVARWAGSAIVSTLNNTDVAVVNFNIRPDSNVAAGNGGVGINDSGAQTYLPSLYKMGTCASAADPGQNWRKFSIVRIQNPTTNNASNVTISYYNRNGTLAHQETGLNIAAGGGLSRNTRNNCGTLTALGNNWEGSMYVSSNQPLVAVAETYYNLWLQPAYGNARWAAGYNAYSVSP
jgi:hypothetical protein